MPRLRLSLLGNFSVRYEGQPPLSLELGKRGALLAYLAMETGRAHSRRGLAQMLWPDRSDTEALDSLRFALANLRGVLQDKSLPQPILLVTRQDVQLNPGAGVWVDAAAFRSQAAALEARSDGPSLPSVEALEAALALYGGGFLHGYERSESLTFETWLLSQRDQIDNLRLRLLYVLARRLEADGDCGKAEESYRSILAVEPWNEDIHRQLMRLLAGSGKRSSALAQYETCRKTLMAELGLEPTRATNQLYEGIKRESGLRSTTASRTSDEPLDLGEANQSAPTPFVARDHEIAWLEASLARALYGEGQVALVTGETGAGKTALLREFSLRAVGDHPDLIVVGGQCDAYTGTGQPYLPFLDGIRMLACEWDGLPWLPMLSPEQRQRLQVALPDTARALVQDAPALLDRFVGRASLAGRLKSAQHQPQALPPWAVSLRQDNPLAGRTHPSLDTGLLYEQVLRLLRTVSRSHPLVLIFDDLQWADPGSASLLFHLARRITGSRILIVAAYRAVEVVTNPSHPLAIVVYELQRYGGKIRIDLDGKDEYEFVSGFLAADPALQPQALDDAFRTALAHHTGGNPLFTIELLHSMQARGDLYRDPTGVWINRPDLRWDHLPERVEAAIAGQIARLPADWQDWLSTASVEGEGFTAELLGKVHGLTDAFLSKVLSDLSSATSAASHLIQPKGVQWVSDGCGSRALSRYAFRHILFQVYLYQRLGPVERSRRHAAIGEALEEIYEGQSDRMVSHAPELAWHFEAGAQPLRAAGYYLKAGRDAALLGAGATAVAHYRHGLALLEPLPPGAERDGLEISLCLGLSAPFLTTSGWGGPERLEAAQQALDLAVKAPDDLDPLVFFPALYDKAEGLLGTGEVVEARRLSERMLALAEGRKAYAASKTERHLPSALAHCVLGLCDAFLGNYVGARIHLEAALSSVAACELSSTIPLIGSDLATISQAFLGTVLLALGYPDQAQSRAAAALDRARRLQRRVALGGALITAGEVAGVRGEAAKLRACGAELLELACTDPAPFFRACGQAMVSYADVLQAEPGSREAASGLKSLRVAMALWETTDTRATRGQWIGRVGHACLRARDADAGLQLLAAELEPPRIQLIQGYLPEVYRLNGELLLQLGESHRGEAEASFLQALEIAAARRTWTWELRAAISLAGLWRKERPDDARRVLESACARFTEGRETQDWRTAQALLQSISEQLGYQLG